MSSMRKKSENIARDLYARKYAAALAVEALIRFRNKTAEITLTIEAEDNELWDDIVQRISPSEHHRYQVKRQLTDMTEDDFSAYIVAATKDASVHYHFAFPVLVSVTDVGEIRILLELCRRIQQTGADPNKVIANLRDAERIWVDAIGRWTGLADSAAVDLLFHIHIDIIGLEDAFESRALYLLESVYGKSAKDAWARIGSFIEGKDGVVNIEPGVLDSLMPQPAMDQIDAFYWSLVEEVEAKLFVNAWEGLTDHLIRKLMPEAFHDNCLVLAQTVKSTAWPNRYPEFEKAFADVAARAYDYVTFFESRSEIRGKFYCENLSYKRIYPNPKYDEEVAASKEWVKECERRLANLIVSLNQFFSIVRTHISKTYRLRNGKLGIVDSLGVTNESSGIVYYPDRHTDA